jgi:hypothetical protein
MNKPAQSSTASKIPKKDFAGKCFGLQFKYKSMLLNHDPSPFPLRREVRCSLAKYYQNCTVLNSSLGGFKGSCLASSHLVPHIALFPYVAAISFKINIP